MSNDKRPKSQFNKAAKGAAIGGGAMLAIGIFTTAPVSIPLIAVGAAVGGYFGYKRGGGNNP